jgi:hypothetical protein
MARTRQPTALTRIDYSNPLSRDLRTVFDPTRLGEFSNSGVTIAPAGGLLTGKFVSASSTYVTKPSGTYTYPLTLFCLHQLNSINVNQGLVSLGGAGHRFLLYYAASNKIAAFSTNGADNGQAIHVSATQAETGVWHAAAGVFIGSASRKVYFDAVEIDANTGSAVVSAPTTFAAGTYWGSGAPVGGFYTNADVALALAWSRALTIDELQQLQRNPWQLFAPSRRVWVQLGPAAGGGTSDGAGSAAGVGAASGVGASLFAGVGSASGVGAATGVGASQFSGVGSAAGVGAATGIGSSISSGSAVGSAAGVGAATGVGASLYAGIGSAAGIAVASGIGAYLATRSGVGSAAGVGAATAVGSYAGASIWTDVGVSAATWSDVGTSTSIWTDL